MAQPTSTPSSKKDHASGKYTAVAVAAPLAKAFISDDAIAALAYQKYEARGRVDGFDQQDWADALSELVNKR